MSLSTLQEKVSKYQPYPVQLLDALKTVKYSPKQTRLKTTNESKTSAMRRGSGGGSLVDQQTKPSYKKPSNVTTVEKVKKNHSKIEVKPLGKSLGHKNIQSIDLIPTLRKLDMETEKEREIQRVMNNLGLSKTSHHRASTTSSKNKESIGTNRSGMDFTSSLLEGHNLTLKQLRDFWSEMPSFLNIHAASLKSKYGIFEKDGTDIDDISIEIVKKCNQPTATTLLPNIGITASRTLNSIQEESPSLVNTELVKVVGST